MCFILNGNFVRCQTKCRLSPNEIRFQGHKINSQVCVCSAHCLRVFRHSLFTVAHKFQRNGWVQSAQNVVHALEWGFFVWLYRFTVWQMSSRQYAHVKQTMENRIRINHTRCTGGWRHQPQSHALLSQLLDFISMPLRLQTHKKSTPINWQQKTQKTSSVHEFNAGSFCCLLRDRDKINHSTDGEPSIRTMQHAIWMLRELTLHRVRSEINSRRCNCWRISMRNESDRIQMICFAMEFKWMSFDDRACHNG